MSKRKSPKQDVVGGQMTDEEVRRILFEPEGKEGRLIYLIRMFAGETGMSYDQVMFTPMAEACYGGLHSHSEIQIRKKFDEAMLEAKRGIADCGCGRRHNN